MKKNIFLLPFCFIFGVSQLISQTTVENYLKHERGLSDFYSEYYSKKKVSFTKPLTYDDIAGSPYLTKEFQDGKILMKDQIKYTIPLRFNLYENNFEFKVDSSILVIGNPQSISEIELNGCKYIYYKLNNKNAFVEIVVSGKNSLICKKEVIFNKAEQEHPLKNTDPAKFSRKSDVYYFVNTENKQFRIKSKKFLVEILSDKKEQIQKFIKKEKISHKKKADLKKLVEYYNTL